MTHIRGGTVYILTNKTNSTLYTGVTSDICTRLREHLDKKYPKSFTARYNLSKLVHMEHFSSIEEAIEREKKIKNKTRKNKEILISRFNPEWNDLGKEVLTW